MIFHVFANRSNIGDWLSAKGIQALLGNPIVTELLCDEPFVPATLDSLRAAGPDDTIIIGGGGLFMDYFAPFWTGFAELAADLRFVVWGVGLVDLKREPSRLAGQGLVEVLRHADACLVRDELTRDHLSGLSLPPPVMCPSIAAVSPAPAARSSLLHVTNYDTVGAPAYEVMRSASQEFANSTQRQFCETNNLIAQGQEGQLGAILELYRQADLVVSSALHGCVIATAMGRRILAVSGDHKIESFMRAAGLGDWVIANDRLELLEERLADLEGQPDVSARIAEELGANRAIARQVLRVIAR